MRKTTKPQSPSAAPGAPTRTGHDAGQGPDKPARTIAQENADLRKGQKG